LHESLISVVNRIHAIGDAVRHNYFDVRVEPPSDGARPQVQLQNGAVKTQFQSA
jgi:hypothetical protein